MIKKYDYIICGAGLSGLFTTLSTGNPLAGLAVAGADVLGSTAIAGGIGKLGNTYLQLLNVARTT